MPFAAAHHEQRVCMSDMLWDTVPWKGQHDDPSLKHSTPVSKGHSHLLFDPPPAKPPEAISKH